MYLISETNNGYYLQNFVSIVWPDFYRWYNIILFTEAFVNNQPYDVDYSYATNGTCIT